MMLVLNNLNWQIKTIAQTTALVMSMPIVMKKMATTAAIAVKGLLEMDHIAKVKQYVN